MTVSKKQIACVRRYTKKACVCYSLTLMRERDADLIQYIADEREGGKSLPQIIRDLYANRKKTIVAEQRLDAVGRVFYTQETEFNTRAEAEAFIKSQTGSGVKWLIDGSEALPD